MFKELFNESIKKLSDEDIDKTIEKWGKVVTFEYDAKAVLELGKKDDVLITKDKKYMHIKPGEFKDIIKKYKLKELDKDFNV